MINRTRRRALSDEVEAEEPKGPYAVYILELLDGSFYVGMTGNIQRRLQEHESSNKRRFVAKTGKRKLVYQEYFDKKTLAEEREQQIKKWSRAKKLALIEGNIEQLKKLSKCRSYSGVIQR